MDIKHKYLESFKKLEACLKKITGAGDDAKFSNILNKAKAINPLFEFKEGLIWDLYGLRNVFAHSDREKYIAEVNKFAFESIDKIIKLIKKPPTVGVVFKKDVYKANLFNNTEDVIKEMHGKLYTHVPIYTNNSKCVGIFSEATIFNWLVDNINVDGKANFHKLQMKDINPKYYHSPNEKNDFIKEETTIFEALKQFQDSINKGMRLGALIITPHGTKKEYPTGIITSWDLPKIKEFLS